jgi:hypothetical protein
MYVHTYVHILYLGKFKVDSKITGKRKIKQDWEENYFKPMEKKCSYTCREKLSKVQETRGYLVLLPPA